MAAEQTAQERLERLRDVITSARSMPMSASCVVNRAEVLTLIDELAEHLPREIAAAQEVIDDARSKVSEGEQQADRIVADARERAEQLAGESEQVRLARERAEAIVAEAEQEAAELRREVESYIDSRMAGFESVLAKTSSQVRIARRRLAEREADHTEHEHVVELPELD